MLDAVMPSPLPGTSSKKGCALTGVDSSTALIDMCKVRFPDQNWVVMHMRKLSLNRRF
jgi:hypothetical protein